MKGAETTVIWGVSGKEVRASVRTRSKDLKARIVLVTHAWHMARAVQAFEQNGFEVVPAATGYQTQSVPLLLEFVPHASAMEDSRRALHELLGRIWYLIRY